MSTGRRVRTIINTQDERLHLSWGPVAISLTAEGGEPYGFGGFGHTYDLDRRKAQALRDALSAALEEERPDA